MNKKHKKNLNRTIVLIKKSNNLVESRYKFDIWETRFFLSILSQIRRDELDLGVYRIWYKDLIKTFDLKSGDSYGLLREAAKSLLKKPFQINYEIEGVKRTQEHVLLKQIDYMDSGQGEAENHEYIDVVVNNDMKPLLLQLQRNFTAYDLRNVTKLGVYSVRMYELLKQYETIGTRTMTIDEMKKMFQVEEQYKLNADFYRWVVKPSETEINRHTDITIYDVEKLKDGRKITTLRFKFRKKTEAELEKMRGKPIHDAIMVVQDADYEDITETIMPIPEPLKILNSLTLDNTDLAKNDDAKDLKRREAEGHSQENLVLELSPIVVTKFGVSLKMFMSLVETYSEEDIRKAMNLTDKMMLTGKIDNIAGFFVEALRGHYQDAEAQKKKVEAEKMAQKKAKIEAIQKMEQDAEDKKKQAIKAQFDKQKRIFERLIEEDDTFWLAMEESIKADNMIKNQYDFDKDIFENMQKPMIAGALMAIAVKLRGEVFL
jgi:plasmid replication initiation protein